MSKNWVLSLIVSLVVSVSLASSWTSETVFSHPDSYVVSAARTNNSVYFIGVEFEGVYSFIQTIDANGKWVYLDKTDQNKEYHRWITANNDLVYTSVIKTVDQEKKICAIRLFDETNKTSEEIYQDTSGELCRENWIFSGPGWVALASTYIQDDKKLAQIVFSNDRGKSWHVFRDLPFKEYYNRVHIAPIDKDSFVLALSTHPTDSGYELYHCAVDSNFKLKTQKIYSSDEGKFRLITKFKDSNRLLVNSRSFKNGLPIGPSVIEDILFDQQWQKVKKTNIEVPALAGATSYLNEMSLSPDETKLAVMGRDQSGANDDQKFAVLREYDFNASKWETVDTVVTGMGGAVTYSPDGLAIYSGGGSTVNEVYTGFIRESKSQ